MTTKMITASAFAACTLLGGAAQADDAAVFPPASGGQSIHIPASTLKFGHTGLKNAQGAEMMTVDVFGDQKTGKHGSFMSYPGQFTSPVHSHTYDYYGIVIKGVMENYNPGKEPVKMGPGSYWYQKGFEAHTTACVSKEPCVIFIVQSQKFDAQIPPQTR
jgi:hypothetical protein